MAEIPNHCFYGEEDDDISAEVLNGFLCDRCSKECIILDFFAGCGCCKSLGLCLPCIKDMMDAYLEKEGTDIKPVKRE